ncbi:MAG: Lyzozyme M1 (1,4-beta-N-acetylmuramidase), partial [Ruminococcus sp.]|nr:Lyzozyme M1 (1,4-beta-N-acetylmuramidase) [Ruminococcus sp.]
MKLYKKLLSAFMSCAFIGASVVSEGIPQAIADDTPDDVLVDLYNSTNPEESKEDEKNTTTTTTTTTTKTAATTTTTASETETSTTTTTTVTSSATQTTQAPFNVFDIYNAHMGYVTTSTTTSGNPLDPSLMQRQAKGIDVSAWQPGIDWTAVKERGIEFAIMRDGY